MKNIARIPFTEISSIPQLIKDFLSKKLPGSEEFVFDIDKIDTQIQQKKNSYSARNRKVFSEVMKSQHEGLELSEKQKHYLELLSEDNTFTVVTGHQLNLFTGPAFFVYKILQTIKTAELITGKAQNTHVVPVFWMATEDHDFEEINHFKTSSALYGMQAKSGGAVGRIGIEDRFFMQDFKAEFKDTLYGTELIRWMEEAYGPEGNLSDATRRLVNRIFSEYGLLIVDGDDARLKELAAPAFQEELLEKKLYNASREQVAFLNEKYGKVQVNPREINLFYLTDTRNRIEYRDDVFSIVDKNIVFTRDEILEELHSHPENFSPNALMRPVFQETVLPNLAYIGGNAEVMYWLELKDYFKQISLPFPVLIPRNSLLFLSAKTLGKIEKSGFEATSFFRNIDDIVKAALLENHELTHLLDRKENEVTAVFNEIKNKAALTDKTFRNLVEAEQTRQMKSFSRMRKRLLRAEKRKHYEKIERLNNLYLEVHPGKNWQERVFNFSVFYADLGPDWLMSCFSNLDVQNSELIIMEI